LRRRIEQATGNTEGGVSALMNNATGRLPSEPLWVTASVVTERRAGVDLWSAQHRIDGKEMQ